jgi:cytochrome P450
MSNNYCVVREPALVREVLSRVDDFGPDNALTAVTPLSTAALRVLGGVGFALPPVLASATGDQHARTREVVARFFSPRRIEDTAPRVVALTEQRAQVAAAALSDGPVDLVRAVTRHIPAAVMGELIGLKPPPIDQLQQWSRDSLELFWGWPEPERQLHLAASAAEFYAWLAEQVRECETAAPNGLFAALKSAGLRPVEIRSLAYFLVIAGQETTVQLGNIAVHRALSTPGQWAELAAGGSHTALVRDVLATFSPVSSWRRLTAVDTELGDTSVAAGTHILLELSGAHPEPMHATDYGLAFGYGLHRCLGARLAEFETTLIIETLTRALPDVHAVGEPEWFELLSFRTPLTLTVTR